jgi:hypothetical protein
MKAGDKQGEGDNMLLRNVDWLSTDYTVSCPRKCYSSNVIILVFKSGSTEGLSMKTAARDEK